MRRDYSAIVSLTAVVSLACGGAKNTGDLSEIRDGLIWFDSYAVSPPPEQGWDIHVDRGKEAVRFARADRSFWQETMRGGPPTVTLITVVKNFRNPDLEPVAAEVAAEERLDGEIARMQKSHEEGLYELKAATKDTVTIAGRHLYAVHYNKAGVRGPDDYRMSESGALYLYFPEGFEDSQVLYEFFISKLFTPLSSFIASDSRDLPEIEPVIASFRYNSETER
jgi:hypothetical protein